MHDRRILVSLFVLVSAGCNEPPADTATLTAALDVDRICPRHSAAYVPYPFQVCDPSLPPPQGPATGALTQIGRLCHTRSGPWYATLEERPHCDNINVNDYTLTIYGIESVGFPWTGTLNDAPAAVKGILYLFLGWSGDACVCCGDRVPCDGLCLPPRSTCGPPQL